MVTGCCSRPRPTGSPDCTKRTVWAGWRTNSRDYEGTGLIIVDEVGYLPFEEDPANLFFELVSSRYEHASLILTSNLPFSGWGGVFGDQVVAAAMIDRIVHHADVLALKGAGHPPSVPVRDRCDGINWRPLANGSVDGDPTPEECFAGGRRPVTEKRSARPTITGRDACTAVSRETSLGSRRQTRTIGAFSMECTESESSVGGGG